MESQLKDRMLSVVAERFKLTSIAQSLSEMGAKSIDQALKMMSDIAPQASKFYPKHAWLDGIYKYLGDRRR